MLVPLNVKCFKLMELQEGTSRLQLLITLLRMPLLQSSKPLSTMA